MKHPTTGEAIELAPDETLQRFTWPGTAVLVSWRIAWPAPAARNGTRLGTRLWRPGPLGRDGLI